MSVWISQLLRDLGLRPLGLKGSTGSGDSCQGSPEIFIPQASCSFPGWQDFFIWLDNTFTVFMWTTTEAPTPASPYRRPGSSYGGPFLSLQCIYHVCRIMKGAQRLHPPHSTLTPPGGERWKWYKQDQRQINCKSPYNLYWRLTETCPSYQPQGQTHLQCDCNPLTNITTFH